MSLRIQHLSLQPDIPLKAGDKPFLWTTGEGRIYCRTETHDVTVCPAREFGNHTKIVTTDVNAWEARLEPTTLLTFSNTA